MTDPIEIQPHEDIDDNEILAINYDMQKAISRYYIEMYKIERLRFKAFLKMLLDAHILVIPSVQACHCPEKPPLMKCTELPLYKNPHEEYNECVANKHKCPRAGIKLVHEYLYPRVSCCRKQIQKTYVDTRCAIQTTARDICRTICEKKESFKCVMRSPDNVLMRQAVVIMGGTAGYLLGGGRGIPRRIVSTSVGILASGALCFPEETDCAFRSFSYVTGKTIIGIYNMTCSKGFMLRERVTCTDHLVPPPPIRSPENKDIKVKV